MQLPSIVNVYRVSQRQAAAVEFSDGTRLRYRVRGQEGGPLEIVEETFSADDSHSVYERATVGHADGFPDWAGAAFFYLGSSLEMYTDHDDTATLAKDWTKLARTIEAGATVDA